MGAESAWSGLAGARKVSVWPDAALQSANACSDMIAAIKGYKNLRNCQNLWFGLFQATSVPVVSAGSGEDAGVMSRGRSRSLPLWN
ncbi:hypothetical protein, partial [Nocardia farcinica]|uniref:hypothetical protein n=1 Tax=Nocardia farcinica TaxID=37329 RepID=UPI001E5AAF2F